MSMPVCLSVKLVLGTFLSMSSVLNSSGKSCLFLFLHGRIHERPMKCVWYHKNVFKNVFLERSKEALAMVTGCVPVSCQRSRLIIT